MPTIKSAFISGRLKLSLSSIFAFKRLKIEREIEKEYFTGCV
jgi:hypothetical protein